MKIIIKKPIISEKSMKQAGRGLYTFLVDKKSRKPEIRKAIAEKFAVEVVAIKTINVKSIKRMQRAKRAYFEIPGYKKAIVELKAGQKIRLFETEAPQEEQKSAPEVKEKKSLLRGTKVKIEKSSALGSQTPEKKKTTAGKREDV